MDLRKRGEFTMDLFTPSQPARSDGLMAVLDQVNRKYGKHALHSGRISFKPEWEMRRRMMSRSITTSLADLPRYR
ncbi:DUF4113 domain-containing protein [Stutzerimonas balearica]|jgi:DNA polymerase V|uniref:DUF4113 domain-containing protein n=1 Tax=Stutzerimonas balearica TaxID=74829 RepID=UPI00311A3744